MKFLKVLGVVILFLVALFFIVALFLPNSVNVEKSVTVKAKPEAVFVLFNDMSMNEKWNPWVLNDSTMVMSYDGAVAGEGAIQSWTSEMSGNGSQTIVESIENEKIAVELDFQEMGTATGEYLFETIGDSVKITWTFSSDMEYPIGRYMGILIKKGLDVNMVDGLNNVAEILEAEANAVPEVSFTDPKIEEIMPMKVVLMKDSVESDQDIPAKLGVMYGNIMGAIQANNIEMTGMPLTTWLFHSETKMVFEAGVPVAADFAVPEGIYIRDFEAADAVVSVFTGPYSMMKPAYDAIDLFIKDMGVAISGPPVEIYLNDPETVAPEELQTKIIFPVIPIVE